MTNENVGGIEIDAAIDLKKFEKNIEQLTGVIQRLEPALSKAEKKMNDLEQKSKGAAGSINKLEDQASKLREKLNTLAPGTDKFIKTATRLGQVERQLKGVRTEAAKLGTETQKAKSEFGTLVKSFITAQIAVQGINTAFRELGKGIKLGMTEPLKQAISFQSVMSKISTVVENDTAPAMAKLNKEVIELSKSLPNSPQEVGIGLYNILQAGIEDTGEAMKLLEAASKAAVGGVTEVGTASKVLTQIQNAYNQTSDETIRQLDAIFVGAQRGSAEFADLAGSLGSVLQSAANLDVPIEEVVAAVETMVNAGLSADESTVALNGLFTSVIQASSGTGDAADAAREMGLAFDSASLRAKGLQGFLAEIADKTEGNEVQMQRLIPNVRGLRAAFATTGKGAEFFNDVLEAMRNETGALDRAFEKMSNDPAVKMQKALNRLNIVALEAGQKVMPQFTNVIDELSNELEENEVQIQAAAEALSGSLVNAMGSVVDNAPAIIQALGTIAQAAAATVNAIARVINESAALFKLSEERVNTKVQAELKAKDKFDYVEHNRNIKSGARPIRQDLLGPKMELGDLSSQDVWGAHLPAKPPMEQAKEVTTALNDITNNKINNIKKTGGASSKENKEREQELERLAKIETERERQVLEARERELRMKKQLGVITEKEETALQRIAGLTGDAFDIRRAETFEEFMNATAKSAEKMVGEFDRLDDSLTSSKRSLEEFYESSETRSQQLLVDLQAVNDELERQFGVGGTGGVRGDERATRLANEFLAAEQAMSGDGASDRQLELIQQIGEITAGANAVNTSQQEKQLQLLQASKEYYDARAKSASREGERTSALQERERIVKQIAELETYIAEQQSRTSETFGDVLKSKIEEIRNFNELSIYEQIQAEEDATDEKIRKELEARKQEIELSQELEKALREDRLEAFIEENEERLSGEQKLHATELRNQQVKIQQEIAQQELAQQQITAILTEQINIRNQASQAYANAENSRLEGVKQRAIAAASAINALYSSSKTINFASGGLVRGPGGPRDDLINARLSDGEFVVQAAATKRFKPLLELINSNSPLIPRFANGGEVTHDSSRTVNQKNYYYGSEGSRQGPIHSRWEARRIIN